MDEKMTIGEIKEEYYKNLKNLKVKFANDLTIVFNKDLNEIFRKYFPYEHDKTGFILSIKSSDFILNAQIIVARKDNKDKGSLFEVFDIKYGDINTKIGYLKEVHGENYQEEIGLFLKDLIKYLDLFFESDLRLILNFYEKMDFGSNNKVNYCIYGI